MTLSPWKMIPHETSVKYLWGTSCILYALRVISALLLGYVGWWLFLVTILTLATLAIWKKVA